MQNFYRKQKKRKTLKVLSVFLGLFLVIKKYFNSRHANYKKIKNVINMFLLCEFKNNVFFLNNLEVI